MAAKFRVTYQVIEVINKTDDNHDTYAAALEAAREIQKTGKAQNIEILPYEVADEEEVSS
jgi:hypothetical protein